MVLVDTSIWIDHLRKADATLSRLLLEGRVLIHPFVIGEIALGVFANKPMILIYLQRLPATSIANDAEILRFISSHSLSGVGIGLVDAHLLAGVFLTRGSTLWTRDNKLLAAARRIGLAASV
jgi:predicted HicB family RNase H-like nuclease/predicted nucleic acid-binding protein